MKKLLYIAIIGLSLLGCEKHDVRYLETVKSENDVPTAIEKLNKIIESKGLEHFYTANHTANAEGVNLELNPVVRVIFGSPKTGTLLMQCNPKIGLDLPLTLLFSTDDKGQTSISYTDPDYLTIKYEIQDEKCLKIIKNTKAAIHKLATAAGKK